MIRQNLQKKNFENEAKRKLKLEILYQIKIFLDIYIRKKNVKAIQLFCVITTSFRKL